MHPLLEAFFVVCWELMVNPFRGLIGAGYCRSKVRLDGKVCIVTGANRGIGKATAALLIKRGAKVIMACRDLESAKEAKKELLLETTDAVLDITKLDLNSLVSVRNFASQVLKTQERIDILVNNAGVFMTPFTLTEDGFESHFGANYLAHFLLTMLLLPKMKEAGDGRVIFVSSVGHVCELSYNESQNYQRLAANNKAQLCKVLFCNELSRRLGPNSSLKTYSVMPGLVMTGIDHELIKMYKHVYCFESVFKLFESVFFQTSKQGAQTTLYCAVDEDAGKQSGLYYADAAVGRTGKSAQDRDAAERLWKLSCELVGLEESDIKKIV